MGRVLEGCSSSQKIALRPYHLQFFIPGAHASKGSYNPKGKGRWRPADPKLEAWEAVISSAAAEVVKCLPKVGITPQYMPALKKTVPLLPPYAIGFGFVYEGKQRPKYWWPSTNDLDKRHRAVLDGLVKGGLLVDDRHYTACLPGNKRFAREGEVEGVWVTIEPDFLAG